MIHIERVLDALRAQLGSHLHTEHTQLIAQSVESLFYPDNNASGQKKHGHLVKWLAVLDALPDINASSMDLSTAAIRIGCSQDASSLRLLEEQLRLLHPWRKGPFDLFGIYIDTEWRSDWKWERLKNHIAPLAQRAVLDVGCGNGYHCWRMAGEGVAFVLGIDPTLIFNMQFYALQKYIPQPPVFVAPMTLEAMPENTAAFDTVFSMGVLYHRRSPLEHLDLLHGQLRTGGELVLETLVIEGNGDDVLQPSERYAMMRNVWSIPCCDLLVKWLEASGFENVRVVDVTVTSIEEQRSTDWMYFDSLPDFLDPDDLAKTIEGYPAPSRAIVLANRK